MSRAETRRLWAVLLGVLVSAAEVCAAAAQATAPAVSARAAALLERDTGRVLYAQNADERLPMASTTKIMTALLAIEHCAPEEMVTVTAEAYGVEGSSMYLTLGETLSMRDLLHGLMLVSGNDAAVAIAMHVGGSIEGFAKMMNQKAAQLGLANTHFVTPNGLHDDAHYTTACDLSLLAAYALRNPAFAALAATRQYRTETGAHVRALQSRNKVLSQYEGGNGVKTGYTSIAGKCLVFAAEREGMQLVGAVLRSGDTYGDAFALLNYGFVSFHRQRVVRAGDTVAYTRLWRGKKNGLALTAAEDIIIPVSETTAFQTRVALRESLRAPVVAGEVCGVLTVVEDGRVLARTALIARETISPAGLREYLDICLAEALH